MSLPTRHTVSVEVELEERPFEGLSGLKCSECEAALDICQPDPVRSDRFLATCSECGMWHLVQHRDDASMIGVVSLEVVAQLHETSRAEITPVGLGYPSV